MAGLRYTFVLVLINNTLTVVGLFEKSLLGRGENLFTACTLNLVTIFGYLDTKCDLPNCRSSIRRLFVDFKFLVGS